MKKLIKDLAQGDRVIMRREPEYGYTVVEPPRREQELDQYVALVQWDGEEGADSRYWDLDAAEGHSVEVQEA